MKNINSYYRYNLAIVLFCAVFILGFTSAQAQDASAAITLPLGDVIDMPVQTKTIDDQLPMTYPMLRMTQDKSEMIKLNREAASVVVGNPNHISVLLDTPTT